MIIEPYKRRPAARGIGVLRADGRVELENGKSPTLHHTPKETLIYADRDIVRARFLIRGAGTGTLWNDAVIKWEHLGRTVYLLPDFPGDGPEVLAGLVALRDYLTAAGATMTGSLTSAASSLLRATITRPLRFPVGDVPKIPELIGGRVEAFGGGYVGGFTEWDISAAYTRTLGELCYNGRWSEWNGRPSLDSSPFPAYYSAELYVPGNLGLIPRRRRRRAAPDTKAEAEVTREYPTERTLRGIWNAREIEAAERMGARVKVRKVWLGAGPLTYPFAPWYEAVKGARALPGIGGTFGKIMGNTLWSRFALNGSRATVTYDDAGRPTITREKPRRKPIPSAVELSELVTSTTRARILTDVLAPYSDRVIAVHTDGVLLTPGPVELPAYWRHKAEGDRLVLIDPNSYAYRDTRTDRTEYVMAGVPAYHARAVFNARLESAYGLRRPRWGSAA